MQIPGGRIRRLSESRLMEARPVLENRLLFRNRQNRRAHRVPAKVVERLPALGPAPPVAVIVAVIVRSVEKVVVQMTLPALQGSQHCLMLSDRGANRTLARENPVL